MYEFGGPSITTSGAGAGMAMLAFLSLVFSIGVTLFWMYVGWRAMRAHERLAGTLRLQERILEQTCHHYMERDRVKDVEEIRRRFDEEFGEESEEGSPLRHGEHGEEF